MIATAAMFTTAVVNMAPVTATARRIRRSWRCTADTSSACSSAAIPYGNSRLAMIGASDIRGTGAI
jgi:hypothetical protein